VKINALFQSDGSIADLADVITKQKFTACFQGDTIIHEYACNFEFLIQLKVL
jgi:hypothetical protein